jgi:hypothetical protein
MPLCTRFQSVCLNRVPLVHVTRKDRVVDMLGVQPGVRVRHLVVSLAASLAQYIPRTAHLLHRHSCTVTLAPHQSHTTPTTQHCICTQHPTLVPLPRLHPHSSPFLVFDTGRRRHCHHAGVTGSSVLNRAAGTHVFGKIEPPWEASPDGV